MAERVLIYSNFFEVLHAESSFRFCPAQVQHDLHEAFRADFDPLNEGIEQGLLLLLGSVAAAREFPQGIANLLLGEASLAECRLGQLRLQPAPFRLQGKQGAFGRLGDDSHADGLGEVANLLLDVLLSLSHLPHFGSFVLLLGIDAGDKFVQDPAVAQRRKDNGTDHVLEIILLYRLGTASVVFGSVAFVIGVELSCHRGAGFPEIGRSASGTEGLSAETVPVLGPELVVLVLVLRPLLLAEVEELTAHDGLDGVLVPHPVALDHTNVFLGLQYLLDIAVAERFSVVFPHTFLLQTLGDGQYGKAVDSVEGEYLPDYRGLVLIDDVAPILHSEAERPVSSQYLPVQDVLSLTSSYLDGKFLRVELVHSVVHRVEKSAHRSFDVRLGDGEKAHSVVEKLPFVLQRIQAVP